MSAARAPSAPGETVFRFEMPEPVPSYLIALAVGDLEFAPLGDRCGVWAEPPVLARAAAEFADTETMMEAAECLFGPYRWGRYDLLVLPPSFPYGGMENPRLTFATPTLLAGDRSLVSVIAHELAHSWSGNLVTNAEWADFWLNEGFTTYCERRIVERVFGTDWAEMEWALGFQTLEQLVKRLPPEDQALRPPLEGRDPDHALTELAYEKGALLLRTLENHAGRPRFDRFLRAWFDRHAFQSVRSDDFVSEATEALLSGDGTGSSVELGAWIHGPGIPTGAALPRALAFERVDAEREEWLLGRIGTSQLLAGRWSTQEWLRFLRGLPPDLPAPRRRELDREFGVGATGNAEIAFQWLLLALQSGEGAEVAKRLEDFLVTIGRRKYVKPLYEELVKTPDGRSRALAIYEKARSGYHPITVETVDRIVAWEQPRH
jgi:leukotriene-A4 hydrolase